MTTYIVRPKSGKDIRLQAEGVTSSEIAVKFLDLGGSPIAAFTFESIWGWWNEAAEIPETHKAHTATKS